MAITQKWHTSRGTACDSERAATIRENAENLAAETHKQVPGLPFKLAADMLTVLMTEGKLLTPPSLPSDTDFDAVDKIADMNDDMAHGREPSGSRPHVEWRVE